MNEARDSVDLFRSDDLGEIDADLRGPGSVAGLEGREIGGSTGVGSVSHIW